jgi:hypothetical protein
MGFKRRTFRATGYVPVSEDTTDKVIDGAKSAGVEFDPSSVVFTDPGICSEGARKVAVSITVDIKEVS